MTKPGGSIKIVQVVGNDIPKLMSANKLVSTIKLAGLVNVQSPKINDFATADEEKEIRETLNIPVGSQCQIAEIDCSVPNFQAGSSKPLSFAQKIKKPVAEKKVWSLKDMDDDDVDLIDEDDLLEEVGNGMKITNFTQEIRENYQHLHFFDKSFVKAKAKEVRFLKIDFTKKLSVRVNFCGVEQMQMLFVKSIF